MGTRKEMVSFVNEVELIGIKKDLEAIKKERYSEIILIANSSARVHAIHGDDSSLAWHSYDLLVDTNGQMERADFCKAAYMPRSFVFYFTLLY